MMQHEGRRVIDGTIDGQWFCICKWCLAAWSRTPGAYEKYLRHTCPWMTPEQILVALDALAEYILIGARE